MTSSSSYALYLTVQANINSIGRGILIVFGTLGTIVNLCIFTQRQMRQNPCSIYLIAFNFGNLFCIWFSLFPLFINEILGTNLIISNLYYCRAYFYLAYILGMLAPSYLILASVDRVLITSPSALTRQRSTRRLAYWSIGGITIVWFLFYCHFWFRINMQTFASFPSCYFDLGTYSIFVNYSSIILNGLLPSVLLGILAGVVLRNIRHSRVHATTRVHLPSKQHQLIKILLMDILISITFSLMQPIFLSYLQTYITNARSADEEVFDDFILSLANFFSYVPFCASFYSNLTISRTFRNKVRQFLSKLYSFYRCQPLADHQHPLAFDSRVVPLKVKTRQQNPQFATTEV